MSTLIDSVLSPNSIPRRAREMTLADQIMFLLGRQATLGQAPPSGPRSTKAVRRPSWPRVQAISFPAAPLPRMRFSYLSTLGIASTPWKKSLRDYERGRHLSGSLPLTSLICPCRVGTPFVPVGLRQKNDSPNSLPGRRAPSQIAGDREIT